MVLFFALRRPSYRAFLGLFVFVFSCNIEAGAPGRHERVLSPRSEGGGTVALVARFFAMRFL